MHLATVSCICGWRQETNVRDRKTLDEIGRGHLKRANPDAGPHEITVKP